MVKIFNEENQITVVFPRTEGAEKAIEKILTDIYGKAEDVHEVEVKALLASKAPQQEEVGVKVVTTQPKKVYKQTNSILKDSRNPFKDKLPYDVFKEKGISALMSYRDMRLGKNEQDSQISRELFRDLKRYLIGINNEDYFENTDLEEIKNIVSVISSTITTVPMDGILKRLAMDTVKTFLSEASESQLRSAAVKVVKDTINLLK